MPPEVQQLARRTSKFPCSVTEMPSRCAINHSISFCKDAHAAFLHPDECVSLAGVVVHSHWLVSRVESPPWLVFAS